MNKDYVHLEYSWCNKTDTFDSARKWIVKFDELLDFTSKKQ